jgi:hypothetical protein
MKRTLSLLLTLILAVGTLIPVAIPVGAVDPPPPPVLIARYPLNGDGLDIGPNSLNGIITGTTSVPGRWGQALAFDGIDDYVAVNSVVDNDITSGITVEAWIKPAMKQNGGIISTDITANLPHKGFDFFFWSSPGNGQLNIDFGTGSTYGRLVWNIPDGSWYGNWHHVAATWDGAFIKIYADGDLVAQRSFVGNYADPGKSLIIGSITPPRYSYLFFNGLIDEVRIWRSALGPGQLDDMLPPVITSENDGQVYLLNQVVTTDSAATDATGTGPGSGFTGVKLNSFNPANGLLVDTSTVGSNSFTVTCKDNAGNTGAKVVNYQVTGFTGFLPPVKSGKTFKRGSTIPFKFQLTDSSGAYVTNAIATIQVHELDGTTPTGTIMDGISTSAASEDNQFRYDTEGNQYIFNLATKNLKANANYRIIVTVNGSGNAYVDIGLK